MQAFRRVQHPSSLNSLTRAVRRTAPSVWLLALVAVSFGAGIVFALAGNRFGPFVAFGAALTMMAVFTIFLRPVLGIAFVIGSFAANLAPVPTSTLGLQPPELAVLVAVGTVAARRIVSGASPLVWSPPMVWAALFLFWALVALPSAVDIGLAARQLAQLIAAFLLSLTVLAACRSMGDAWIVVATFLVVGTLIALFGISETEGLQPTYQAAAVRNRPESVLNQPNHLGSFTGVLLCVALGVVFGTRRVWIRITAWVAAAAAAATLGLSLSRGAWLGSFLALALLFAILPAARRFLLSIGIPALAAAFIAVSGNFAPEVLELQAVQVVTERASGLVSAVENPYSDRPEIYREAARQISLDPWTGFGPGNFPAVSARAVSPVRTVGAYHAHNTMLTVAAEVGLPGIALLLGLTAALGQTVVSCIKRLRSRATRGLVAGAGAGLFLQVGQGLVDFNFRNPVILFTAAILVGLVLVCRREAETDADGVTRSNKQAYASPPNVP